MALHALLAEFDNGEALLAATRRAYEDGYRRMDAYSPYPVEGLSSALGERGNRLPLVTLVAGLAGGLGAYLLQYWVSVVQYPHNVGGRPVHSWPAFVPVAFETTILCAALSVVAAMLLTSGLPRFHHPLFDVPGFARATSDGFFLCIEARDPRFDAHATRTFLERLRARTVSDVAD
jgi:hypothetical protein